MSGVTSIPHHLDEDTPSLPPVKKVKKELPLTFEERRVLALEVADHLNFFPKSFESKHAYVLGLILHQLTDPRVVKPLELRRGTRVISALKKNKGLWERLKPFFIPIQSWSSRQCKCGHMKDDHANRKGKCKETRGYPRVNCRCDHFRGKEL